MGTTYYCDSAGSNTAPYETWAKAATAIQTLFDTATAGDLCYCRGTQTLAAKVDVDTQQGSFAAGMIRFIGCNAEGDIDGTRFVIDGDGAAVNCLDNSVTPKDFYWIENFELKNATGDGFKSGAAGDCWVWVNTISHNNGLSGFGGASADYHFFFRCQSYSNTDHGWTGQATQCYLNFCVAWDNGDIGFYPGSTCWFYGCISHDNGADAGDYGFFLKGYVGNMWNCVADGEVAGVFVSSDLVSILCSRLTNNATAIDFSSELTILGWNVIHGSTVADYANPASIDYIKSYAIPLDADSDTNEIDPDADDGYNARGSDDFNLKASRTYNGDGTDVIDMNIGS